MDVIGVWMELIGATELGAHYTIWLSTTVTMVGLGSIGLFMLNHIRQLFIDLKWSLNWKCKHPEIRCIHGDEIILAGYRRSACLTCPAVFDSLPELCSFTGELHPSFKQTNY